MACRRKCYEDGHPIDRPTAYHATEAETLRTGGGDRPGCDTWAYRSTAPCAWPLKWNMSSTEAEQRRAYCAQFADHTYRSEAKSPLYRGYIRFRLTYAAPAWYAICSASQRKRIQAQQYALNDVITRDLCIETVEEFIQRIARRIYDIADQGPYEFLRNIAPMHEKSPSGRPLSRELIKTPPPKKERANTLVQTVRRFYDPPTGRSRSERRNAKRSTTTTTTTRARPPLLTARSIARRYRMAITPRYNRVANFRLIESDAAAAVRRKKKHRFILSLRRLRPPIVYLPANTMEQVKGRASYDIYKPISGVHVRLAT
ncbi:hypothetical protein EVAR_22102_1 [Eumeta japonica]|uniref:Uncharacterized protein n=1 Tax=Eumeta variegata TaxID=151549 RepID=A0A4C1VYV4_EUMVA|nr:hypothetical protein EVAR_22102_1 [Eumeta japonica]